jgi:hypothetical protein
MLIASLGGVLAALIHQLGGVLYHLHILIDTPIVTGK